MFFPLSKIFWAVFTPLTFIALMVLLGTMFRRTACGKRLLSLGIVLFILCGFLPLGPNLIVALEGKYGKPEPMPASVTGIVVLGGMIDSERSEIHDQTSLNDDAERLTEMIRLSRIYPQARVIFTGGTGKLDQDSPKESEKVEKLLKDLGIDTSRFEFESASRNTFENMTYSRDLVHPQAGDTWLLVTSAFHMPRSVAVFEKGGWDVVPYPAGYLEDGAYILRPRLDVLGNFYKLQVATKEIVGIIAYSLTDKL